VAADMAICSMLGLDADRLPTNRAAKKLGLAGDKIYISGDFNMVNDFSFPEPGSLTFGPPYLHKFMRKHLTHRPVVDKRLCKLCSECWKYCPAKAIGWNYKKIFFDYNSCIRCYCCIEICPQGAIRAKEPLLGRLARRLFNE